MLCEGACATGDEDQSWVRRFEKQRSKDFGHYICTSHVDVPRFVPHVSYCHVALGYLLVELRSCAKSVWVQVYRGFHIRTRIVEKNINLAMFSGDCFERLSDRSVILKVDLDSLNAVRRVGVLLFDFVDSS